MQELNTSTWITFFTLLQVHDDVHAQSHFNFHFCSLHFGKLRVHIEVARLDRYVGALWKKNCILWPLVNYSVIRKNTRLLCCQIQLKMHFLIKAAAISKGFAFKIVNILKQKRQHNIFKLFSIHSFLDSTEKREAEFSLT